MNQYLNERCSKILKILLEHKEPITTTRISEEMNVSNRTIRYDLEELDGFLAQYEGVKIEKKARVGIWLQCSEGKLSNLKELAYSNKTYIKPLSTEERKYYIIRQLIQAEDIIKMQNLANDLYVSRITIHNDLNEVEVWLSKFNLKLIRKQNFGLQIFGDEKNWRKAASSLLAVLKSSEELKSMIIEAEELQYESRLNHKSFIKIKELIPEIDLRVIEIILNESEKIFKLSLTDEAFEGLLVHIAISIRRLNSKNGVELKQDQLISIKEVKEYEVGQWIAERFKNEFHIEFSESEIAYLTLHILGSKIHENVQLSRQDKIVDNVDDKLKLFIKEIMNLVGNILGYKLNNDERLYNGLIVHLRPAINRMTYGMNLRNPIIEEIKSKYPAIFGATWATSTLFEKYYQVKVSEEEIGYIALHVGAALERLDTSIKGIVVCGSGIGTCELVAARLLKQVSNLTIVGTFSLYDIKALDRDGYDLIITTVPIEQAALYNKPIVNISPLTSDEDIIKIKKVAQNIEFSKNALGFRKEYLLNSNYDLFIEELNILKVESQSKIEIMTKLSEILLDKGFVDKGFTTSVIERENLTATAVGRGVAIPHGAEKLVKRSCISIAVLKEPIEWGGEMVDIIFLLALRLEDKSYIKKFFSYFYSILDDDNTLNKIRKSKSSKEIIEILSNFNQ
ncbi:MAG: transcription antiterminator [Clostridiaceae bacterium]|nr:transcription antiterminator [Clostridiaceae bacterium]